MSEDVQIKRNTNKYCNNKYTKKNFDAFRRAQRAKLKEANSCTPMLKIVNRQQFVLSNILKTKQHKKPIKTISFI